jgi:hypothetical protein
MRIKIADTNRTPFWGLPESESRDMVVHLSSENNEFREIDHTGLTPYQQQTLWSAIKMGTISAEDDEQFQDSFKSMLKEYLQKRQETQTSQVREIFGIDQQQNKQAVENVQKVEKLKKLMNGSVATLKKQLVNYSAADLELVRKIETHGKNRKTVLKFISDLILKQTKASVSKVESPNAPTTEQYQNKQVRKTSGMESAFLSNVSNVRESDVEEVTIKIGEG